MNNWNQLEDHSRIWLYGAGRKLNEEEVQAISVILSDFCGSWAAHGTKLKCGFTILYDQVIVLGVDEKVEAASGCSIDSSVAVITQISDRYQLDLFNRLRTYILDKETDSVEAMTLEQIKQAIQNGMVTRNDKVVNMQASTLSEIKLDATVPMRETWLKRFLLETSNN